MCSTPASLVFLIFAAPGDYYNYRDYNKQNNGHQNPDLPRLHARIVRLENLHAFVIYISVYYFIFHELIKFTLFNKEPIKADELTQGAYG